MWCQWSAGLSDSGIPYTLTNRFTRPGLEIGKQAEFLARELETNPDYLIFTLDIGEHANFIEQAISRGTSRIILQNITTPIARWRGRQPFLYVGFDHQTGTRMLAEKYIEMTGGIGRYAILYGTRGYVSKMRGDSFRVEMDQHPGLHLVDAFYVGFDRQKSPAGDGRAAGEASRYPPLSIALRLTSLLARWTQSAGPGASMTSSSTGGAADPMN